MFASGDVHRSEFRKLERTNAYPMYELVSSPMSRDDAGKCEPPTGSKAIACYDGGNSFITVDVDGVAPVPSLKARIVDESGAVRADLTLSRSELESR